MPGSACGSSSPANLSPVSSPHRGAAAKSRLSMPPMFRRRLGSFSGLKGPPKVSPSAADARPPTGLKLPGFGFSGKSIPPKKVVAASGLSRRETFAVPKPPTLSKLARQDTLTQPKSLLQRPTNRGETLTKKEPTGLFKLGRKDTFVQPKLERKDTFVQPKFERKDTFVRHKLGRKDTFVQPKLEHKDTFARPKIERQDTFIKPKFGRQDTFIEPQACALPTFDPPEVPKTPETEKPVPVSRGTETKVHPFLSDPATPDSVTAINATFEMSPNLSVTFAEDSEKSVLNATFEAIDKVGKSALNATFEANDKTDKTDINASCEGPGLDATIESDDKAGKTDPNTSALDATFDKSAVGDMSTITEESALSFASNLSGAMSPMFQRAADAPPRSLDESSTCLSLSGAWRRKWTWAMIEDELKDGDRITDEPEPDFLDLGAED